MEEKNPEVLYIRRMKLFKKATQMPSVWKTKDLVIRDAIEEELPALEKIAIDCGYIEQWTGLKYEKGDMLKEFRGQVLPPNGKKERNRTQTIASKKTNKPVGYVIFYHGYPKKDVMWIGALMISPKHQGKKYGQQLVTQFAKEAKKLRGFSSIGIGVAVKNWPAMRFWIANGFTRIIKIKGDKTHAEKAFADLHLLKNI